MKKITLKLHSLVAIVAVAAILAGTTAFAASDSVKKVIEANYMGIKLVVDGVEVTPKDPNGNAVDPFISEGTTYLPVRAVGEALGKTVTWDGDTKTVYIGKVPGTEDNWMVKLPPYLTDAAEIFDGTDHKASFDVAGETQTLGVVLGQDGWGAWSKPFAVWNTSAQYSTMTFTVGFTGSRQSNGKLTVYLDGEYSTEYDLKFDTAPKTFTVDLKHSPNVKLSLTDPEGGSIIGRYAIYNISFS